MYTTHNKLLKDELFSVRSSKLRLHQEKKDRHLQYAWWLPVHTCCTSTEISSIWLNILHKLFVSIWVGHNWVTELNLTEFITISLWILKKCSLWYLILFSSFFFSSGNHYLPCSPHGVLRRSFNVISMESEVKWSHSVVSDSATPWTVACQAPQSM